MAMIEMIEIIHFNETWQRNTKARGNCHGSLIVVAATTLKLFMTIVPLLTLVYSPYFDDGLHLSLPTIKYY